MRDLHLEEYAKGYQKAMKDVEKVLDDELKAIVKRMCSDEVLGGSEEWSELWYREKEVNILKQKLLGDGKK